MTAKTPAKQQDEIDKTLLKALLSPEAGAAYITIHHRKNTPVVQMDEATITDIMMNLFDDNDRLMKGKNPLALAERTLQAQATALNQMFVALASRATNQEYVKNFEVYMRLALKAQSQCRATLETLATIKNPPVVFAKQANIAQNQQVNNGTASTPPDALQDAQTTASISHCQSQPLPAKTKQSAQKRAINV